MPPLELWGGAECTVNRVGDRYIDQIKLTGHDRRPSDLALVAALGIRALRYPVLWERVAPHGIDQADWSWTDGRLQQLRTLDIRVIAGLIHHGSGPRSTSLVDRAFPRAAARFARATAERYPWLDHYTPINEPLTTARFSGLYGHWFPHARDDRTFVRALLIQCRAVVLSMQAIRAVTPDAQLVQTDDLGRTSSTPLLRYQADLENERRWLTFDLLCGRVNKDHPLWEWLIGPGGATEADLEWFCQYTCPPNIIGLNHYLSSERYLDEDLSRYPEDCRGGNGCHRYADDLTARVREHGPHGPGSLLRTAWQRYGAPIAVTEAHNGCSREEQMRWFLEVWEAAEAARRDGVEVRAVTAWSLFGVHGWDRLVTGGGRYEPGVFDVRGPTPRATAMVPMLRALARGDRPRHPLLTVPGWWRRPDRHIFGFARSDDGAVVPRSIPSINRQFPTVSPVLITGGGGTLGQAFARVCERRGVPYRLLTHQELDIADASAIRCAIDGLRPWGIVNAAGYVRVDEAEADESTCFQQNADGPTTLASICGSAGLPLLTFSSDLVFDGSKRSPYLERDPVSPVTVYGRSKVEAERRVRAIYPEALIARTSAFFGPWDDANFVTGTLRTLAAGDTVVVPDQVVSPTYVPDLVDAALDLLIDGESGIWHLANHGAVSWYDLARMVAEMGSLVRPSIRLYEGDLPARRPAYSVLESEHGRLLPDLGDALERYLCAVAHQHEHSQEVSGVPLAV
jgi:dTDP-4-dehydrorhamnose reductase